ncbi:MAG: efflux RND transporter periplasmic adaptor subunit [Chloroflexi bacterium]|nr:efflux RND transporter periplasmic adaptor subunit [Chloroflexota bacterium]
MKDTDGQAASLKEPNVTNRRLVIIAAIMLVITGAIGWYVWDNRGYLGLANLGQETIAASGTIEAEESELGVEIGGKVKAIAVDEGTGVHKGDVLLQLDDALLQAQIRQAQAVVDSAKAAYNQLAVGARPEEIVMARAGVAQAMAWRDGAQKAWENAKAVRSNPQELNAKIDAARAQLAMAAHQVGQAQANKEAAEYLKDQSEPLASLPFREGKQRYNTAVYQWWAAWSALDVALANKEGAERNLDNLLEMKRNPLSLNAQVDAAYAQYQAYVAAADAAQARLAALEAGATKEQLEVAQAQVRQAEAALGVLLVQLDKLSLHSPIEGLVTNVAVRVGEMAAPGTTVVTVADLDKMRLTVYIPQDQVGRVKHGQGVQVRTDSFPGQVFPGEVVYISPKAEFTPKNVQTQKERVNTVFAVRIKLANPEHFLKPGMPADAQIATGK